MVSKQVIGDLLRSRTDRSRATEVAALALNFHAGTWTPDLRPYRLNHRSGRVTAPVSHIHAMRLNKRLRQR